MVILSLLFSTKTTSKITTQQEVYSNNVDINWENSYGKRCLNFEFGKKLTLKDAYETIENWDNMMRDVEDKEQINLIWNCKEMSSYETGARLLWQRALRRHQHNIGIVYMITESALVQMGADMLSFFTSQTIKTVKSRSELNRILASA